MTGMLGQAHTPKLACMHTCLTLTNVDGLEYVERHVSQLLAALEEYCDAIHSSDIRVEGPCSKSEARCWRVELKVRIFDEMVFALTRTPAGNDPEESLSAVLSDLYARATARMTHIAERHHGCCTVANRSVIVPADAREPDPACATSGPRSLASRLLSGFSRIAPGHHRG